MTPEGWTAEAWQEQMHAEVKVAYRLVELGLVGDPDSIPYDPEEVARIDAEYDKWKDEVERASAEKAWDEGYTRGNAHNGRRDDCPYRAEACRQEREDHGGDSIDAW